MKKLISIIICISLFCTNLTVAQAQENAYSMGEITCNSENLGDGKVRETATYIENNINVKLETIMTNNKVTELFIYEDGKLTEHQIYDFDNNIQNYEMNPLQRGPYDYLTFTSYQLVDSFSGSTSLDNIRSVTVSSALIIITGGLLGAGTIAALASTIVSGLLNMGYVSSSKTDLKYKVKKYWSNSIDTNTDYVFRTKFVYTYYDTQWRYVTTDTEVMYTVNNPI